MFKHYPEAMSHDVQGWVKFLYTYGLKNFQIMQVGIGQGNILVFAVPTVIYTKCKLSLVRERQMHIVVKIEK